MGQCHYGLLFLLLAGIAACSSTPRFDDGAGHARPLAAWLLQGYAGDYRLACDDGSRPLLQVSGGDGSVRLDGRPFVGPAAAGDIVLEGNGGSPAHTEADRIGYDGGGRPGVLALPAYPATLSLTVHRAAGAGPRVLALVRDLVGGPPRLTLADAASSHACTVVTVQGSGGEGVRPGWLIGRLAQQRDVFCRSSLMAPAWPGRFAISPAGVVRFPDGRQWPVDPASGVDWNFQLQDAGSFGDGGYRLLLDSDVTPRSLLGREAGFDREGELRDLHYIDASGSSVDCHAF